MSRSIFIVAALALIAILPAVSAQAQSPRTFVSAAGNDSNPCTFAAPCRHFQAAVNATSAGGEVDALDPAGYGPIVISQAVTIEGQGWSYIAPPAGGNGITINAVSGNVSIHGVSLNGVGITGTTTGIAFISGGSLTIHDSIIRNFSGAGIALAPTASATIAVSHTLVAENGNHGIYLQPSGNQPVHAVFNRVEVYHNAQKGIGIFGNLQAAGVLLEVVVVDSVAAYNTDGFYALGNPINAPNLDAVLKVNRSTTIGNTGAGLHAESSAVIWVSQTDMSESPNQWVEDSSSCIQSYGDNYTYGLSSPCGNPAKK
jgi:hypothetical protein